MREWFKTYNEFSLFVALFAIHDLETVPLSFLLALSVCLSVQYFFPTLYLSSPPLFIMYFLLLYFHLFRPLFINFLPIPASFSRFLPALYTFLRKMSHKLNEFKLLKLWTLLSSRHESIHSHFMWDICLFVELIDVVVFLFIPIPCTISYLKHSSLSSRYFITLFFGSLSIFPTSRSKSTHSIYWINNEIIVTRNLRALTHRNCLFIFLFVGLLHTFSYFNTFKKYTKRELWAENIILLSIEVVPLQMFYAFAPMVKYERWNCYPSIQIGIQMLHAKEFDVFWLRYEYKFSYWQCVKITIQND